MISNWRKKQKIKEIDMEIGIWYKAILKLDNKRIAVGLFNGEMVILN